MENLPMKIEEISPILARFGIEGQNITGFQDTSRGEGDTRWNFILDNRYVLKINSQKGMWENRLQEISRLINRYRSIGVSCPALLPTLAGTLSCIWEKDGQAYICYVEEFAKYPICTWGMEMDRKECVAHLGRLAAAYSNVDLPPIHSMWSIIDLSPFDETVDEKQENADTLIEALEGSGFQELADRVKALNQALRQEIAAHFRELPRCVFQGDLNLTNMLHDNGHFVGLIDFNCSGTDVNINVFANEVGWFPEEGDFDIMSIPEILEKMEFDAADTASAIFESYQMNALERELYPCFQRIADLFQYPNVCSMAAWLKDDNRREKCAGLIAALTEKSLCG